MADKRSGKCLCGAVRVTVTDPAPHLNACHCSMCRRWTGLAFVTLDVPEGQIEIEGAEAVKAFTSSDWAQRCFCGTCGSTLWYRLTAPGAPTDYYMAAGLLDDLSGLTLANEMTPEEQKQMTSLLLREGITGLLQRLGIRDHN